MERFTHEGNTLAFRSFGTGDTTYVWAHGWGHSHANMAPIASGLETLGRHVLIDFPGFGEAPPPTADWSTTDYARLTAAWLATQPEGKRIWIGHSFGCRVGLVVAAEHPDALNGLFLMSAAGIPRRRSALEQLSLNARIYSYKLLKRLVQGDEGRAWLQKRFGSADYKAAGALRGSLVKVIGENLTDQAKAVRCPVRLVYGEQDVTTPPSMGRDFETLIPGAKLLLLPGFDHYSILDRGQHQVAHLIEQFAKETP